ncbi:hypothetical protein [Anatilimnocola floriformis]|uniref:hypothetical protein n=1 Tax=Anatilimnocola floriformis TaxID=2948575 RepID=UPI0020C344A0|nr:hypothetical protein [Anatilimnocola floriformis]
MSLRMKVKNLPGNSGSSHFENDPQLASIAATIGSHLRICPLFGCFSMNPIDPNLGLHQLCKAFQKTYQQAQADAVCLNLDRLIENTIRLAPVRREPYPLRRSLGRIVQGPESLIEEAMWRHWHPREGCQSVPGAWHRIVSYQVMLRDTNLDQSWGEIDLLGVSPQAMPVVIEIKQGKNPETPLRMVVEAAAYGVAMMKAWSVFGPQWAKVVHEKYGLDLEPSPQLKCCPLVCAAPETYWAEWLGNNPRAATVTPGAWVAVRKLIAALAERGLPATFWALELIPSTDEASNLPLIGRVRGLDPLGL